jgi:hypothetical protein
MVMDKCLKRDICDLCVPGASVKNIQPGLLDLRLPPHIRYACRYWAQHVEHSSDPLRNYNHIRSFMRIHLLHWLEAMSLLGEMSASIETMALLETLSVSCTADAVVKEKVANWF